MSKKKSTSMIGHDPLAWINEPEDKADAQNNSQAEQGSEQVVEEVVKKEIEETVEETVEKEVTTIEDVVDTAVVHEVVVLQGDLTIQYVQDLHQQLDLALQVSGDIQLDASAVGRVDTAGVQLLYAFAKRVKASGHRLIWLQGAASLQEVATTLGMADAFQFEAS